MSVTDGSTELLTDAFRRFEDAACRLERRHSSLQDTVDELEKRLADANRRTQTILETQAQGVAILDAAGNLLHANPAFERLGFGRSEEPIADTELRELVASSDGPSHTVRLQRETDAGLRDLNVTIVPVGDEDRSRVLTIDDVTELRRQEREGGRKQRLQALGRMAAELAHEVRNPLGSIRLFATMLSEDLADQPASQEMAERILGASAGLESTVSNLLAFANPHSGEMREIDIAEVAEDVCDLMAPVCSLRGVDLVGPRQREACWVDADSEGMRQVLLNLVGNSITATDDRGRIRIDVARSGDDAILTVEDDGHGIASEDLPRVFDPFFSRTEGGTGLGLSIVHGIVERLGGRVSLESRKGRGTCAKVILPALSQRGEAIHG